MLIRDIVHGPVEVALLQLPNLTGRRFSIFLRRQGVMMTVLALGINICM